MSNSAVNSTTTSDNPVSSQPKPRPNVMVEEHPAITGRCVLETPEISRLLSVVHMWVMVLLVTGAVIIGRPRAGKTRGRWAVATYLRDILGDAGVVYEIDVEGDTRPTRNLFYQLLLEALGHCDVRSGTADHKRQRVIEYLLVTAGKLKANNPGKVPTFVFCIDESQNLSEDNYQTLIHIYNKLDDAQVHACFLLFGQPELTFERNTFRENGKHQIVARFMAREHRFYGVRNSDEMTRVLEEYDLAQYPAESGWTFTEFFFPEAFSEGKRLANFGKTFFEAFKELATAAKIADDSIEIPMIYVAEAIMFLCRYYGFQGQNRVPWLSNDIIKQAVNFSSYAGAELGLVRA